MRASEFVLKLADLLDAAEKLSGGSSVSDSTDDNTTMMIPPLQQKIELLKKVSNVDSVYDNPEGATPTDKFIQTHNSIGAIIGTDEVTECRNIRRK